MTQRGIDEEEAEIDDPEQKAPAMVFVGHHVAPGHELPAASAFAGLDAIETYQRHFSIVAPIPALFYCRPRGQFRPLWTMWRAWYQTKTAAGSSSTRVFVPPIRASRPSTISAAVQAIVFLEFAFFEFAIISETPGLRESTGYLINRRGRFDTNEASAAKARIFIGSLRHG